MNNYNLIQPPLTDDLLDNFRHREKTIKQFGFVYITNDWLQPFLRFLSGKKVLEVMAGTGALSKVLLDNRIDIRATDDMSWHERRNWTTYTDVENLDAVEAVKKYNNVDYIIMSWPPYESPIALRVLQTMRIYNPKASIIYIGEGYGGCTADDDFHDEGLFSGLTDVNKHYKPFYGIHDYFSLVQ